MRQVPKSDELAHIIGSRGYKTFSCSTGLSMELKPLIINKMLKIKIFLVYKLSYAVFIMLINVKMPTIVGILTFMSMIKFMLS